MCTKLPCEVWTLVFRLLPHSDRFRVRATCKHFRDLVDNALFRDWTVELTKSGEKYKEDFWHLLCRWKVTSACVSSPHRWKRIAKKLPGLSILTINNKHCNALRDLKSFTNLQRLHLILYMSVDFKDMSRFLPQQMTSFKVCLLTSSDLINLPPDIPPKSQFNKLKSLVLHCAFAFNPVMVINFFISSLPQLQHLSLKVSVPAYSECNISDLPLLHNCSLSSLELVECTPINLQMDFMKMLSPLPFLRSLAIFCPYYKYNLYDESESQKLSTWLRDLPFLTSLVVRSTIVDGFVRSIPSSVTRLILMPKYIDSYEITSLSAQLPNLRHLHLEPHRPPLGSDTALIPRLFPKLKTLRIRHEEVSEDVFLSLASLKELEVLETLDSEPLPAALVSKLRTLTNNRVLIFRRSRKPWLWSCSCSFFIPTEYWA